METIQKIAKLENWKREERNTIDSHVGYWGPFLTEEESLELCDEKFEDETGEMTCLLTKRSGDDRDRAHEQILEAGLMPDDVMGVSGTFSQTGDIFYVDDLHFPLEHKHIKVSKEDFEKMAIPRSLSPGGKGKEGKGKTKLSPSDKGGKAAGRGNDDVRPATADEIQAVNAFRQAAAIK